MAEDCTSTGFSGEGRCIEPAVTEDGLCAEHRRQQYEERFYVYEGRRGPRADCRVCGRSGYSTSVSGAPLLRWEVSCMGEHPHGCTCGRAFVTRNGLTNHIRLTTDVGDHAARETP